MVPKLNLVAMGLLIAGLLTAITVLALSGPDSNRQLSDAEISALVNRLGSDDPEIVRRSRQELIDCGTRALPLLRSAGSRDDRKMKKVVSEIIQAIEVHP